jgi:hypothetical protein
MREIRLLIGIGAAVARGPGHDGWPSVTMMETADSRQG